MLEVIGRWVNWALVANSFLIFLGFAWFLIALLGRSLEIPLGFDLWLRLWEPFFTPALGLFMGGAILSGIIGLIKKRWPSSPQSPKA